MQGLREPEEEGRRRKEGGEGRRRVRDRHRRWRKEEGEEGGRRWEGKGKEGEEREEATRRA